MRDIRLPVALTLIVSLALAGCAAAGGAANESTVPSSSAEMRETKGVEAEPEEKTEESADRPAALVATAEAERPVPATAPTPAPRDEGATPASRLVTQLNDATREIATLRASNAKLRATTAKPPAPTVIREPDPAEVKLAASFRSYAQFKQELTGFFADLEKVRAENAAMSAELKEANASSKEARAALAKLESELQYEKGARNQAEQTIAKLREQLRAVAEAVAAAGLSFDRVPSGAEPTARLETSRARLRAAAEAGRPHVVKDGDTLETIAERYYGDRAKWRLILEANRGRLPLDGSLPPGLELEIPAK